MNLAAHLTTNPTFADGSFSAVFLPIAVTVVLSAVTAASVWFFGGHRKDEATAGEMVADSYSNLVTDLQAELKRVKDNHAEDVVRLQKALDEQRRECDQQNRQMQDELAALRRIIQHGP